MEKCSICMRKVAEESKIHAYSEEGEGCCKTCWDWLKTHFPVNVEGKGE